MKGLALLLALLLPACASVPKSGGPIGKSTGAVKEQRKSEAKPQHLPVEAPPPAHSDQVGPPRKREHNIEED